MLGAGEGIASLRIPFHAADGKGAVTGETWASWNPVGTDKAGARGSVEWHRRDLSFEARGLHRQWTYASGTSGFHNYLAVETGLGRTPEWRAGAYRLWETHSTRQGYSLTAESRWKNLRLRPGLLLESKDDEITTTVSFWTHWSISKSWRFELDSSTPISNFAADQTRWRTTLRYIK